jgi:hypothetical protein
LRACLPARGCPAITPGKFPTLIIILISQEIFKCQESADSRNALRSPRKTSVVGRRRYRMVCANAIRLYMVRSGVNDNAQRPRRIGRLAGSQNNSLRRPEGRDDVTVRYSDIGRTAYSDRVVMPEVRTPSVRYQCRAGRRRGCVLRGDGSRRCARQTFTSLFCCQRLLGHKLTPRPECGRDPKM